MNVELMISARRARTMQHSAWTRPRAISSSDRAIMRAEDSGDYPRHSVAWFDARNGN